MTRSVECTQQWVKEWAVGVDPEVEVQVLPPHEKPRERGEIIPIRLGRRGYQITIGFPEQMLAGPALADDTRRALQHGIRQLDYMETRDLPIQMQ